MESPSSDRQLWSSLQSRVEAILEDPRRQKKPICRSPSQLHEDSLLLARGFDSVSSSLAQLGGILDNATQEARELAKPSMDDVLWREGGAAEEKIEGDGPKRKRSRTSGREDNATTATKKKDGDAAGEEEEEEDANKNNGGVERAKKMAMSMATKAASLSRELKKIKEDSRFEQERCRQLEEENKRLRKGLECGLRPEEDDLVRLQLETLLAEKSRLANENAILTRDNECLHQLVEYHQITSQELSESYEEAIQGMCLDFSPFVDRQSDRDSAAPSTPKALDCSSSTAAGV